jgi:hypothetical protein
MGDRDELTFERRILDRHPEVRKRAMGSGAYLRWRDSLPAVVVDGVRYFIRGGDMLKDDDQVLVEWAHKTGLLPLEPPEPPDPEHLPDVTSG